MTTNKESLNFGYGALNFIDFGIFGILIPPCPPPPIFACNKYTNFSPGNHQCLGRFFASAEIKVVMVGFLLGWDIRLVGDKKRPANYMYDTVVSPDPFAEVEIRRRVV